MHPIIIKQRTSDDNYRNLCPNYTVIVPRTESNILCILYDGNDEVGTYYYYYNVYYTTTPYRQ